MSDDEDVFSTRRITADEMAKIQQALESRVVDYQLSVTADVAERFERLLRKMEEGSEENDELKRAMAIRQVFMAGLYALESEFE